MQQQRFWFNVSDMGHSGFLVTDIIEVIGSVDDLSPSFVQRMYLRTLDGGYILKPRSQHFFTEEDAIAYMESFQETSWMVVERY